MCSNHERSQLEGYGHAEYSGGGTAAIISALTSVSSLDNIRVVASYEGDRDRGSMTLNLSSSRLL